MTNPAPAPVYTGQPTIDGIIGFLLDLVAKVDPAVEPELEAAAAALGTVRELFNPAAGKEVEREAELATMLANKDVAGLQAFYDDEPPHPKLSRSIAADDLALLGHPVSGSA